MKLAIQNQHSMMPLIDFLPRALRSSQTRFRCAAVLSCMQHEYREHWSGEYHFALDNSFRENAP